MAFLSAKLNEILEIGMITGTGLGALKERITANVRFPYNDVPHFPRSKELRPRK